MKVLYVLLTVLTGYLITGCNTNKEARAAGVEVQQLVGPKSTDDAPLPPSEVTATYTPLQKWLAKVCDTNKPDTAIATYSFGLFESAEGYTLYLVGSKDYKKGRYGVNVIHYEPSSMYYQLPKSEYKDLKREEVLDKLTAELKDFTQTDRFRRSFFTRAKAVTTDFRGEIWTQ